LFTVFYCCLLFFTNSCNKNTPDFQADQIDYKALTTKWVEQEILKSPESSLFIDSLLKNAQWNKLNSNSINEKETLIYIPVTSDSNNIGVVVILNTQKNKIVEGYIAKFSFANETNKEKPSNIITRFYKHKLIGFLVSISGFDVSNKFLWEMGYKNGFNSYKKIILKPNKNQLKQTKSIKSNSVSNNIEPNSCTAFYLVTYWSDGSIDYEFLGASCTNTCEQTISIDNKLQNIIRSNCGGSGGNNVSGGSPAIEDVKTKLTDPCLQMIINQLLNGSISNAITKILKDVFSVNDKVNVTFEQTSSVTGNNGYPVPAHTSSDQIYVNGVMNHKITLNSSILNGASQEYKAAAIIHEIIHTSLTIASANSLSVGITPPNNYQHFIMLSGYMDEMSQSLKDFFPDITLEQAKSLSLGGLSNDVAVLEHFDTLITRWGFNNNQSSAQHWDYFSQRHKVGEAGSPCNPNRGTTGSELN